MVVAAIVNVINSKCCSVCVFYQMVTARQFHSNLVTALSNILLNGQRCKQAKESWLLFIWWQVIKKQASLYINSRYICIALLPEKTQVLRYLYANNSA